jgi:methylase of polypeptide subunit release factors
MESIFGSRAEARSCVDGWHFRNGGYRMTTEKLSLWLSLVEVTRGMRLAVAGWHFGVDAVSILHDHIWDGTSLVLRKAIRRYANDGQRVLDLGTGHLGLLAVYCALTHQVKSVAVDVSSEFIENARLVAVASHASLIDFRQSDWFSNVDGTFDLIFGNVPYIPTKVGKAFKEAREYPEIWDGGGDGLYHERHVIANVARFLNSEGLFLLGIDTFYVPRSTTLTLIKARCDLELREIIRSRISQSEVYVIGLKRGASLMTQATTIV